MGDRCLENERVTYGGEHGTKVRAGKHADNDGHIPAARAAGFLNVLIQSPIVIIDNMAVSGSIGVNVSDLMAVRGGRVVNVTAGIAVVIWSGFPCCGLGRGNKCCLNGKCQHSHHHDDSAHTSSKGLRNQPQLGASAAVPETPLCQLTPGRGDPSISCLGCDLG
jgi:hypothetical protein